ncbi:ferritin-like domain-containing protein [Desertivirga xinjiangensis]|uniref:ferritin-like domain-containing protein n=1 Tax=Desertivirga xinjiangensis TaxID=539206 RepID=UPI00210B052E|nr:PA2169 family four-helix-bundle protein [Pedobacter xinjiangensis]
METNKKIVQHLRHLLAIANDGKEGYKNAAENADAPELKALFTTYSIQRAEFEMELKSCIHQLGGEADNEHGGPLGALHRTWIDIKTALTPNDNSAVLGAAITGEKAALNSYDDVLVESDISYDIRQTLLNHREDINECLRNIEKLEHQYAHS